MASINDLIARVGVEGIPAFKGAFKDAIEALETTESRANRVGQSLSKALSGLGIEGSATQLAAAAKKIQSQFELLDAALKKGAITPEVYAKAVEGLKVKLSALGDTTEPLVAKIGRINDAFKRIGVVDSKFQIGTQVDALKKDLDELEREYKQGAVSAEDFAKAQKHVAAELDRLTKIPVKSFADSLKGIENAANGLKSAGTAFTVGITVPITAAIGVTSKFASEFELAMRQVTSLMGDLGEQSFKPLSDGVLELSKRLGIDAVGAARALYEAISAGVPKENALSFLEVASKAAIAGVTQTKVAVDGMTTIMNAYRLEAGKVTEVSDAMFQAVNIGKFTFEQLASSLAQATPLAAQLGVGFKDLLAAASTLTSKGVPVSEAMTQIAAAMRSIISPSEKMELLFKKIGVSSGEALISSRGLQGALEAVRTAAGGSAKVLSDATGRIEGFNAILSLTGDNSKKAREDIDSLNKSVGATDKAFAEINKSFSRQVDALLNQAKVIGIEFGNALLPLGKDILSGLKPVAEAIGEAVKWFAQLPEPVRLSGLAVAGFMAALGPLTYGAGAIAGSIVDIANAFKLLKGLEIGASVAGLATNLTSIGAAALTSTPLLIAFGAAIAGWALYKGITQLQELEAQMDRTTNAAQRGIKASTDQAAQIAVLENSLKRAGKATDESLRTLFDGSTANPIADYIEKLKAAAGQLDDFKGKAVQSSNLLKGGKIDIHAAAVEYGLLSEKVKQSGKETKTAAQLAEEAAERERRAAEARTKAAGESLRATQALSVAFGKLNLKSSGLDEDIFGVKPLEDAIGVIEKAYLRGDKAADGHKITIQDVKRSYQALDSAIVEAAKKVENEANKSATDLALAFGKAQEAMRLKASVQLDVPDLQGQIALVKKRIQETFSALKGDDANLISNALYAPVAGGSGKATWEQLKQASDWAHRLNDALKQVRGNQESLTVQAKRSAQAYHDIQDAVDGIKPNPAMATQFQATLQLVRALGDEIERLRQEAPISPFNNAELQKTQELLKQAKSDLASIRTPEDAYNELGLKSIKDLQIAVERTAKAYDILRASGTASAGDIAAAQRQLIEDQIELAKAVGRPWADLEVALDRANQQIERIAKNKGLDNLTASVANFATTLNAEFGKLADGAGQALSDALFNPKSLGASLTKLWGTFKDSMKAALGDALKTAFIDPITNGLKDAMSNIVGGFLKELSGGISGGIGKSLSNVLGGNSGSGILGGVFGKGGGFSNTTIGAKDDIYSMGGGSGGSGGIGSALSGGGAADLVTGAIKAVSGVISNFQFYAMNKSLDIIVKHTLEIKNELSHFRADAWTREGHLMAKLDDLAQFTWTKLDDITTNVQQKGDDTVRAIEAVKFAIASIGGGGSGAIVEAPAAALQLLYEATKDGFAGLTSAFQIGIDRLVSTLGLIADTQSTAKIDQYTKQIGDLLTANANLDTQIGNLTNTLKGISEKDVAQRDKIISQIVALEADRDKNLALIGSLKDGLNAIATGIENTRIENAKVTGSIDQMSQRLADLIQEQVAFLEKLPPDIRAQLETGKLAELADSQDAFSIAALKEYQRIAQGIINVKTAIDGLRSGSAAPSTGSGATGPLNAESMTFDPSKVTSSIVPIQVDSGIPAFIGAIANLGDRMSAYWDKLFEVLKTAPAASQQAMENVAAQTGAVVDGTQAIAGGVTELAYTVSRTTEAVEAVVAAVENNTGVTMQGWRVLGEFARAPVAGAYRGPGSDGYAPPSFTRLNLTQPPATSEWTGGSGRRGSLQQFPIRPQGQEQPVVNVTVRNIVNGRDIGDAMFEASVIGGTYI
jgi:TP901 family phage tail tape measure protein